MSALHENPKAPVEEMGVVVSRKEIAPGIIDLFVEAPKIAEKALPGQFVSFYCRDLSRLLPRPISIASAKEGKVRFVFRVAGAGTFEFSSLGSGDVLRLVGPLGNGYPNTEGGALLLGGGIGIPPLLFLAESRKNAGDTAILGYRDENLFLLPAFSSVVDARVATEDGSCGVKGNVLDAAEDVKKPYQTIFACGPMPMLKAVARYAKEQGKECFLSLEERMACGVGACLGCSIKGKEGRKRVCKEGPVFNSKELSWE